MFLHQILMAASAAAFLVVPETVDHGEDSFSALPFDAYTADIPAHAMSQTVDVPCSGCEGDQTHLSMELAVEDGTRLTMNGFELYPSTDPWRGDLMATVVEGEQQQDQKLGYAMAVTPMGYDEDQALEVIKVSLHIIEVGFEFIDDIPKVDITLIKAHTNEILLGDVRMEEQSRPACESMFCQVKQGIDKAWKGLKAGCNKHHGHHGHHGHHRHQGKPHAQADGERLQPGRHGHHAHAHNWLGLLKFIAIDIALPVLTLVVAGVGFALLFIGFCCFIAVVANFRRIICKSSSSKARPTEPAAEEEKTGLMETEADDQEPPPQYEGRQGHVQL
ncbi:uncharacterized protein J7T54_006120 [Emericellopsis cladophorae]|uniref:DUF7728 domain-containing protein n=1 Tax=Emericellopsis cladophorae TaxID=2686198 RepID=A0A9Q0BI26_9HYPO|nr:uncharacterized protein J7T54_006120 [Emericellopsis cladophorae]KAI6785781.1 hypothetical protein J7T54_006120 [Emericellopsis cladophorae]